MVEETAIVDKIQNRVRLPGEEELEKWWDEADPSEFQWIGQRIPEKHWRFLQTRATNFVNHQPEVSDSFELIRPAVRGLLGVDDRLEACSVSDFIDKNHQFESSLVQEAFKDEPHEVGQIRVFLSDGSVRLGPLVHGKTFEMPAKPRGPIRRLLKEVRADLPPGVSIVEVEYNHVHPIFEFLNRTQNETTTAPMSFADHVGISEASSSVKKILVTMKAIVPNGYSYRNSYLNGDDGVSRSEYWQEKGLALPRELRSEIARNLAPLAKPEVEDLSAVETVKLLRMYKGSRAKRRAAAIKRELVEHRDVAPRKLSELFASETSRRRR